MKLTDKAVGTVIGVLFGALLLVTVVMSSGCSVFEEDETGPTIDPGEYGSDCTYNWECKSNSCVYPGKCGY